MGYRTNVQAVLNESRAYLVQLLDSAQKEENFVWKVSDPRRFAHILREALTVLKTDGKTSFAELKDQFRIREKPGVVVAEYKIRKGKLLAEAIGASEIPKLVITEKLTVNQIIGAVLTHDVDELEFPNVDLGEKGFNVLQQFCVVKDIECFDLGEKGILLKRIKHGE